MATRNRGKKSNDDKDFAASWHPIFTQAADDLGYLLTRGYASNSALEIVGNRYRLNKRQRTALLRISASEQSIAKRKKTNCSIASLQNERVEIDGFNLLILLESALSGAYILKCRDGAYRDMSSVHGSYKRVVQTENAIQLIGRVLKEVGVDSVCWYLDQPVSNSGRLKSKLLEISEANDFDWEVELVYSPDKVLAESTAIVVTSDAWILDHAQRWFNLGAYLLEEYVVEIEVVRV